MPIDYTNVIYDKIIKNLRKTIGGELSVPVYMDQHRGSGSIPYRSCRRYFVKYVFIWARKRIYN